MQEFGYKNPMQVPRLEKIVVNMGVGEAVQDSKKVEAAANDLTAITGQHPVIIKAKRSIATFKLRQGMQIGCKVTLRRQRMYEFLDRLITVALPRVRDFRGVSGRSFDGRGNFALGLKEQLVFPEIDYDRVDATRGMDVVVVTTAEDRCRGQGAPQSLRHAVRQLNCTRRYLQVAKKSSIEKNARRMKLAKSAAGRRARLKAIAIDRSGPARGTVCSSTETCRVAAQRLRNAGSQPLLADRTAARLLPQIQIVAHRAARARLLRANPGHGQVELVGRRDHDDERSSRRHADADPQRPKGAAGGRCFTRLEDPRQCARSAEARRLYPRLHPRACASGSRPN